MRILFKRKQKIIKGTSSAVVLSMLIHAGIFLLAGLFVVFTVIDKAEPEFVAPPAVDRPKMKLKKPQVRLKKTSRPKQTSKILTKVNKANMPEIQLPEMSGVGDGLAGGMGPSGFDMMPDLDEVSIFGGEKTIGNDFEGTVYSLVRSRTGGPASMDEDSFRDVLRKYVLSGWKNSVLASYYQAPNKRYTTHFMVPPLPTSMAPGVFGAPELEDYWIFIKYEGQLVHRTDIKFRFWGVGDAYIFVNVNGKEVLLSSWDFHQPWFDWWTSSAGGDRTHLLGNQRMVIGDWIELKGGEPVDMKVLFGEWNGGEVTGMLLVEVEGEKYPTSRTGGPLLPAFKTAEFSWDDLTEISRFLAADECSLTNGPVFNDFYIPPTERAFSGEIASTAAEQANSPAAPAEEISPVRLWTMENGNSVEGEFVTMVGREVLVKTTQGKQVRLPVMQLSEEDLVFTRLNVPPDLDINLGRTTEDRKFGDTIDGTESTVRASFNTFSTEIKQKSVRPYGLGLAAEMFVIGNEFGGDKRILLDYKKEHFTLTKENDFKFKFFGKKIELLDYSLNSERRGKKYDTFLVIVTDERGRVIAYKTPSENLYDNLDNLRELKPGWYFDKDCKRCLPTPPRPWTEGNAN